MTAASWGIRNHLYESDELDARVFEIAEQICQRNEYLNTLASNGPSLAGTKHLKPEGVSMGIFQKASLIVVSVIATLCLFFLIVSALGADYQSGVSATVLKKSSVTGNGQKIIYPVTDRAEVTVMTVNLAPGAETGWHSHPIPVYAYVVEGLLEVELEGGQVITYKSGDAIIEVVNTLHTGRNRGPEEVRLVVFYTGAEGTPSVVKPSTSTYESK